MTHIPTTAPTTTGALPPPPSAAATLTDEPRATTPDRDVDAFERAPSSPRSTTSEPVDSNGEADDGALETTGHVVSGVAEAAGVTRGLGAVAKRVIAPVGWAIDGVNLGLAIKEGVETGNYRRVATTSAAIGGSLGGAAAGAALGTAILPGVGTFIGGVIGAVSGGTGASWIGGQIFDWVGSWF